MAPVSRGSAVLPHFPCSPTISLHLSFPPRITKAPTSTCAILYLFLTPPPPALPLPPMTLLYRVVCLHTAPLSFWNAPFAMPNSFSSSADCGFVSTKKVVKFISNDLRTPPRNLGPATSVLFRSILGLTCHVTKRQQCLRASRAFGLKKKFHWTRAHNFPKS